jgi:hypothetical protein
MKLKILLSVLFIFAFTSLSISQNNLIFGIKAGVTLSNPSIEPNSNYNIDAKSGLGFNFGISVDVIRVNNFTLSSELYYTNKRTDFTYKYGSYSTFSLTQNVDYLIYGITGKYKFDLHSFRPYIFAEPRLNFYLGDDIVQASYPISPAYKEMISDHYKKFGFGFNFGAGIDFIRSSNYYMFAEAHFCPDLFTSYEDTNGKAKSNAFEFKIGCGF